MAEPHPVRVASFSETPVGRYRADGDESGQVFREDVLIPALNKFERVRLVLDGVDGLPSSFWEEVMGGLIRDGWQLEELRKKLDIETEDRELKTYVRLGWRYAQEESDKRR